MALILANARLIDPESGYDGPGALRIEDGLIADVAKGATPAAPEGAEVMDCGGMPLAPGIVDMRVFVGEPGARHKESYRTAGAAAAAGGVTTIAVQPDTDPPVDDPAVLEFAMRRAERASLVHVAPMAALTRGMKGREMAEYGFLLDAGALAFTDANQPVADPTVFRNCLDYAHAMGALIVHHPQDPAMTAEGSVTESLYASMLGLPGAHPFAERIMLERDMALVEITGARYHADLVTTRGALEALRRAKDKGLPVSAATSHHHFTLNEHDLADYPTFFKLDPPLREEEDRAAVAEAVAEGLIDVLCSSHRPQDEESKRQPFEIAAAGAVGLETLLPGALKLWHDGAIGLPALFERLSLAPARLLGLPAGRLAAGAPADLVLFDPDAPYVLDRFALRSKSKNTPFDRRLMTGRALRTFVGGREVFTHGVV
ncbi:amidohydrolase family protein [Pikeienuella piscinae]|uniref:Amidohydrolase family protein n=1 Tax=Pikeienuella piscinae TaxID=2748098 RepID=A0A7L5BXM1_9RHOB|nr:dihydroorotase [Pikeienuella piscinae]QIE54349.1 amidohydrolase family protein [Pikeienuella piscinae]